MKYKHTYKLLKDAGHSPLKASQIILDAMRGDELALTWIRNLRYLRSIA